MKPFVCSMKLVYQSKKSGKYTKLFLFYRLLIHFWKRVKKTYFKWLKFCYFEHDYFCWTIKFLRILDNGILFSFTIVFLKLLLNWRRATSKMSELRNDNYINTRLAQEFWYGILNGNCAGFFLTFSKIKTLTYYSSLFDDSSQVFWTF